MPLLACGSIHQGHERFSCQSRGKQCSFTSLSVLLSEQAIPVLEWNSATIDSVLVQGDHMYLNAFENDNIPREGFLSLNHFPTVVRWSEERCQSVIDTISPIEANDYTKLPIALTNIDLPIVVEPVEAQNSSDLPIVVEPIEAQNNIDLPIVVEPIEAQNNIDLPIVVEPIEAQHDRSENQNWLSTMEKIVKV